MTTEPKKFWILPAELPSNKKSCAGKFPAQEVFCLILRYKGLIRSRCSVSELIMLNFHRTTEPEKYEICSWKYEGAYAIYDSTPYEEQRKSGKGFADPRNNLFSFYDDEKLVGYINLSEEESEVFFG